MKKDIVKLQNEIKEKRIELYNLELYNLEQEYDKYPRNVLMYTKSKGKHTFVYHSLKQVHNLEVNGWEIVEDFNVKATQLGLL